LIKVALYVTVVIALNVLMYTEIWASAYLSAVIVLTYLIYKPNEVLHPNNMLLAFNGLYIVVSSTLNLTLHLIDWEYVIPWGQQVYWNELSKYVLFQAEFTFLILFFSFRHFSGKSHSSIPKQHIEVDFRIPAIYLLTLVNIVLVFWFLQSTAGITNWLSDYSYTYLAKREGHGLLNIVAITIGNALVFILGMWTLHAKRKLIPCANAAVAIVLQSYMNGFKGRFIFLLLLFFAPWLMKMKLNLKSLLGFSALFFGLLYTATLVRTEGFYASAPFFLEMLIGYFNTHQLHELVVTSRDPGFFQTVWQIFVKPLQVLGLAAADADFDISVMLTKEFFPDHWDLEKATQQWPLDTELYLNYYGFYFSWLPLILYGLFIGKLFRAAVSKQMIWLMPIFMLEFSRIFSALRGTLIPWEVFFMLVQYPVIFWLTKRCLPRQPSVR
jgi:hypothetical protein